MRIVGSRRRHAPFFVVVTVVTPPTSERATPTETHSTGAGSTLGAGGSRPQRVAVSRSRRGNRNGRLLLLPTLTERGVDVGVVIDERMGVRIARGFLLTFSTLEKQHGNKYVKQRDQYWQNLGSANGKMQRNVPVSQLMRSPMAFLSTNPSHRRGFRRILSPNRLRPNIGPGMEPASVALGHR